MKQTDKGYKLSVAVGKAYHVPWHWYWFWRERKVVVRL